MIPAHADTLTIVHYPDPRLRKPCAEVESFDQTLRRLADRMFALMREAKGVGLAAPQVGVNVRLFVMDAGPDHGGPHAFVNPAVRQLSGTVESEEGCLSIPGVRVQVRRAQRCVIEARDLDGRPLRLEGAELPARVWQHETDHLNGVLILDRMGPGDRIAVRKTLRALEAGFQES